MLSFKDSFCAFVHGIQNRRNDIGDNIGNTQEHIQKQHLVEHHRNHQQDQLQQLWDSIQLYYMLETFRRLEEQIGNFFGEFARMN
jgi:hypothetical protein